MENNSETIDHYDLNVISKGQAVQSLVAPVNAGYDWYVEASKKIIKSLICQQAVIGFYATKICTIRHGGRSDGFYTLSDFARDIGVHRKTLNEWTAIYRRVIQHLDIDPLKMNQKEWSTARRIAYQIEGDTRHRNKANGTPKGKSITNLPKREEIRKLFMENSNGPTVKYEVMEWGNRLRTLYSNLSKRDLSLASENDLLEIMKVSDKISDLINDYLTDKKRKGKNND